MGSERSEGHAPLVARVAEGRLLDGVKVTEVLAPPTAAAGARLLGPGGEGGLERAFRRFRRGVRGLAADAVSGGAR